MKYTIRTLVFLIPTVFMSVLFYLATVDDGTGSEFYKGEPETGNPVSIDGEQSKANSPGDLTSTSTVANTADPSPGLRRLYKWRDGDNTIIISTESPPSEASVETFYFRAGNVSKPVKPSDSGSGTISGKPIPNDSSFINNPFKVYTPSGLKELINYSKAIGDKIELRSKELNELIEQVQSP